VGVLSYLTSQEMEVLRWTLLVLSLLLIVLGVWETIHPLLAFKKADATFVAAEHLPAAPHIYHVSFSYEVDGEPYESTTRNTYDERTVERKFKAKDHQRVYYRKKEPTYIRTGRASEVLLGFAAFLIGAAILAFDLWISGYITLPPTL